MADRGDGRLRLLGSGDSVAVDNRVVGRGIGGIDADAPEGDGGKHGEGQECCFHGGHLGRLPFLCALNRVTDSLHEPVKRFEHA